MLEKIDSQIMKVDEYKLFKITMEKWIKQEFAIVNDFVAKLSPEERKTLNDILHTELCVNELKNQPRKIVKIKPE